MIARSMGLLAAFLAALLALAVVFSPASPVGYIHPLAWLVGTAVVWQGYRRYRLPGSKAIFLGFSLLLAGALAGTFRWLLFLIVASLPAVPSDLAFHWGEFLLISPAIGLPGLVDVPYERIYNSYLVPVVGLPALTGAILIIIGLWGFRREALRRRAGGG